MYEDKENQAESEYNLARKAIVSKPFDSRLVDLQNFEVWEENVSETFQSLDICINLPEQNNDVLSRSITHQSRVTSKNLQRSNQVSKTYQEEQINVALLENNDMIEFADYFLAFQEFMSDKNGTAIPHMNEPLKSQLIAYLMHSQDLPGDSDRRSQRNPDSLIDSLSSDGIMRLLNDFMQNQARLSSNQALSPKDCFGVATLAKVLKDDDLQKSANDYIAKNLKMIAASNSLITLASPNILKYMRSCDLTKFEKLQLIEAKLKVNLLKDESFDQPSFKKKDIELIKMAAALSAENRLKYPALTSYCHTALKCELTSFNCLETAVLASKYKLDELKVWAEFHLIQNFDKILDNRFPIDLIEQFLESSYLPWQMYGAMLQRPAKVKSKSASIENVHHVHNRTANTSRFSNTSEGFHSLETSKQTRWQVDPSEWLLSELIKLSSTKTKTIGIEGGTMELDGCSLTFPQGALSEDTSITMMVNTDPDNSSKVGMAITPILKVHPSTIFEKPVTVKLESCFRSYYNERTMVSLQRKEEGSDWKHERDLILGSRHEISFDVWHFTAFEGVIKTNEGMFLIKNDVFIQSDTGMITSYFYTHEKDEGDVREAMRSKSCASFLTATMDIEIPSIEDDMKLEIKLIKSEVETPLQQECWAPDNVVKCKKVFNRRQAYTQANPGYVISKLKAGDQLTGKYKVTVGSEEEGPFWLKRKWPITLDPERIEPPRVAAGIYVESGGTANQTQNSNSNHIG